MELNKKMYKYTAIISMTIVFMLVANLILPMLSIADTTEQIANLSTEYNPDTKEITANGSISEKYMNSLLFWVSTDKPVPSKNNIDDLAYWCIENAIKDVVTINSTTIKDTIKINKPGKYYAVVIIKQKNEDGVEEYIKALVASRTIGEVVEVDKNELGEEVKEEIAGNQEQNEINKEEEARKQEEAKKQEENKNQEQVKEKQNVEVSEDDKPMVIDIKKEDKNNNDEYQDIVEEINNEVTNNENKEDNSKTKNKFELIENNLKSLLERKNNDIIQNNNQNDSNNKKDNKESNNSGNSIDNNNSNNNNNNNSNDYKELLPNNSAEKKSADNTTNKTELLENNVLLKGNEANNDVKNSMTNNDNYADKAVKEIPQTGANNTGLIVGIVFFSMIGVTSFVKYLKAEE